MGKRWPPVEPFYHALGAQLARFRRLAGLTQAEVGAKLRPQIEGQSVSNAEHGRQRVLAYTVWQYAQMYGVPVDLLLRLADRRSRTPRARRRRSP
jgi:transcriptional regulator with XRE-family HTH domain